MAIKCHYFILSDKSPDTATSTVCMLSAFLGKFQNIEIWLKKMKSSWKWLYNVKFSWLVAKNLA